MTNAILSNQFWSMDEGIMAPPHQHFDMAVILETTQYEEGQRIASDVPEMVTGSIKISDGKKGLHELLERNRLWAESVVESAPFFFQKLSKQQSPEILWIGCSDARVPPNQILNLKPGEVFVHVNLANEVGKEQLPQRYELPVGDRICRRPLKSQAHHRVYVSVYDHGRGHYGCSGVKAALSRQEFGMVDNWIRNIKDLYIEQRKKFKDLGEDEVLHMLTEANVAKSVYNVCHTRIVQKAWKRGHNVSVHGWCYSIDDGIIRDLNICVSEDTQIEPIYRRMMQKRSSVMGFDDMTSSKMAEMLHSLSHSSSTVT
ncbi:hypothetical protein AaE_000526 [Aphanomyces astaci]|uniref:Carbonic anhydrase n=1 Tax=Aphanomyces astaci TaxID=112090 RepID=A0A6A5B131_APHAT|nr:hypothetical protein AaE_000526 [Aphanomyces astaci]